MADTAPKLTGPDLRAGIDASALEPGASVLGHVEGDAVLLARVGNDYFAIGASCSHYGGPLAEGVVDRDTVRCPWHHACFSLRTGDALRAPALSPLPCWIVTKEGQRIIVGEKKERDPLAVTLPLKGVATEMSRGIVIVGAGAAGSAAAEMARRSGFLGRVRLIDPDGDAPYDRPNLSKDYLAGNAPEEWIPLRPATFYQDHDIDRVRARVERIDAKARAVTLSSGEQVVYDQLLLATGAEPIRLGLEGEKEPHVHYLRSLADSRGIIKAVGSAKRAVVIGGSFIGLEVAASLRARGLDVDVVAPESVPLERVLGSALGQMIKAIHESHGVTFHLGHKPARITRSHVELDDGARLAADLVVIGVGVRPVLGIAEQAGLALDRGVRVNECLETSVPGVFAAGDIARWPDPHSNQPVRVEHWVVAQRMGQTAARNMLGAKERFNAPPFFWSAHYDVIVNYVGHAEQWDDVRVDGDPSKHDCRVEYRKGGRTLATATVFRDQESLRAELEMERALAHR